MQLHQLWHNTEQALEKMLKRDLTTIVQSLQNKITDDKNDMFQEILKFNNNFAKLSPELIVTKKVNSELCTQLVTMERQCWANSQY